MIVVGGSGFIGSHVVDQLNHHGFEVVIFDQKKSNWVENDQEIVLGSILDRDLIAKVVDGAKYVYHFAGIADINEASLNPHETFNLNVMGTANLLEICSLSNIDRFIFASSMYVYSPYGSYYTASKQCSEIIIEAFQKETNLDYTLLRYGSLYGPRAQDWNGLNSFITQIVQSGKLEYFGTGEEKREHIHVEDAARLSAEIIFAKEYINAAVTITGTQVYNSRELIDMIFEISGKKPNVTMNLNEDTRNHYIKTPYRYNPKNARKLTPESFVDIGQGILEIIEHLDNRDSLD